MIAALIGLFLLVVGVVLVTSRRARHLVPVEVPPVPEAPAGTFDPVGAVEGVDGHRADVGPARRRGTPRPEPPTPTSTTATETSTESPADSHDGPAPQHPHDPEEVTR